MIKKFLFLLIFIIFISSYNAYCPPETFIPNGYVLFDTQNAVEGALVSFRDMREGNEGELLSEVYSDEYGYYQSAYDYYGVHESISVECSYSYDSCKTYDSPTVIYQSYPVANFVYECAEYPPTPTPTPTPQPTPTPSPTPTMTPTPTPIFTPTPWITPTPIISRVEDALLYSSILFYPDIFNDFYSDFLVAFGGVFVIIFCIAFFKKIVMKF